MELYYHGAGKTRSFFEGWYFKHCSDEHTLILIPALHQDGTGRRTASLQVIADGRSFFIPFGEKDMEAYPKRLYIRLGQNYFTSKGCRVHLDIPGLSIRGHIHYGPLTPPRRSFMGPFRHLPLPCFHRVLSLSHPLKGRILFNQKVWDFRQGQGYIETDWGHSFPSAYLWAQCSFPARDSASKGKASSPAGSVMFTAAGLEFGRRRLIACSSLIAHGGRQYRLSTYQGARLTRCGGRRITLRQGGYTLQLILPQDDAVALKAPDEGSMKRTVYENPRCLMRCALTKGSQLLFDETGNSASYERAAGRI